MRETWTLAVFGLMNNVDAICAFDLRRRIAAFHRRRDLFDEERVAVGAREHLGEHVGSRRAAENPLELLRHFGPVEAVELDPPHVAAAFELGEQLRQRRPRRTSSDWQVHSSSTGSVRSALTRNARRSRVERSAQWRSSTTRTNGCCAAIRPTTPRSISNKGLVLPASVGGADPGFAADDDDTRLAGGAALERGVEHGEFACPADDGGRDDVGPHGWEPVTGARPRGSCVISGAGGGAG